MNIKTRFVDVPKGTKCLAKIGIALTDCKSEFTDRKLYVRMEVLERASDSDLVKMHELCEEIEKCVKRISEREINNAKELRQVDEIEIS